MTATRYILSTNGVDLSATYGDRSKAIEAAQAYVWGAERTEREATEQTHVISVRTAKTGKIVFNQTVTVPAKVDDVCGGTHELCSLASKTGQCGCATPEPVALETAVQSRSVDMIQPSKVTAGMEIANGRDANMIVRAVRPVFTNARVVTEIKYSVSGKIYTGRWEDGDGMPVLLMDASKLDVATLNTDNSILCGWCDYPADRKIQIACQSHPQYACAVHFREWFPYLANPQMVSALCPNIESGCSHTMAQNEAGYSVACVEYADARGIQWRYA